MKGVLKPCHCGVLVSPFVMYGGTKSGFLFCLCRARDHEAESGRAGAHLMFVMPEDVVLEICSPFMARFPGVSVCVGAR